jgi:hypothetical protein
MNSKNEQPQAISWGTELGEYSADYNNGISIGIGGGTCEGGSEGWNG